MLKLAVQVYNFFKVTNFSVNSYQRESESGQLISICLSFFKLYLGSAS